MIDVNAGNRFALLRTCDFSLSYVKINVDYRTRVFTHF
jgi:N-acetylglutamate synthase/N-acetylornithine aminotransferase